VAEIASTSASYDLGKILDVYRPNGVRECLVWRVVERQLDWFEIREAASNQCSLSSTASCDAVRSPAFGSIRPR
jgi:hypothetical protein